jgi:hypothetical protein
MDIDLAENQNEEKKKKKKKRVHEIDSTSSREGYTGNFWIHGGISILRWISST